MRFLFLVVALVQAVYGGNVGVRTSGLLSPAGVTYVDGSYHAGLAAGPVAYSASVAQPVYQSAGFSATGYAATAAAAPAVAVAAQPVFQSAGISATAAPAVAVASAPVAYAAPAARFAAIPTVQHVPGVADVPVTRVDAQPAVIQKTVDLARPAVKTQRFEVRRPAIQKQFYDIEERVVVRPAGSALVELEEPLSRTQKGPSVIRPTGEAVVTSSSSSIAVPGAGAGVGAGGSSVGAPAPPPSVGPPAPADFPSVEINLARDSVAAAAPSAAPSVGFSGASFASAPAVNVRTEYSAPIPPPSAVGYARPTFTASAPVGVPTVGVTRTSVVAAPAPPVEVRTSYQAPASFPTVSYSAPAVATQQVGFAAAPVRTVSVSAPAVATQQVGFSAAPIRTVSVSAPVQTATVSGITAISSGASGISSVSAGPTEVSFSTPAPQYQQIVQSTPSSQLSDDSISIDSAGLRSEGFRSYTGSTTAFVASAPASAPVPTQTVFRTEVPRRIVAQSAPSARGSLIVNYPNAVDLIPQTRFSSAGAYSGRSLQSDVNHENQQRLIQLLTARGGVSEIGFGRSGSASYPVEAGSVRARVLSATPAPQFAAPTGERVNTRRVVVSRPIETLQEVEVAEPVTKFERVRVDQPGVVKTASQDIVRVPTSVPVYGKTLAPIAEAPVAAYSPAWK